MAGASDAAGGSRSEPFGSAGAVTAGCSAPNWSITEAVDASRAARMVMVIEVAMKPIANTHVTLPKAVAAARPEMAPPPEPMPKPPPSDRCNSTTPINSRARMRWMVRITFSMVGLS